jgi:hypothetical protein
MYVYNLLRMANVYEEYRTGTRGKNLVSTTTHYVHSLLMALSADSSKQRRVRIYSPSRNVGQVPRRRNARPQARYESKRRIQVSAQC